MKKYFVPIVLLLAFVSKFAFFSTYRIHSISMSPTLSPGDRILCRKLNVLSRNGATDYLSRKDIVVFKLDSSISKTPPSKIIKRIVGLPGDTIQIKMGSVIINGQYMNDLNSLYQKGLNITDESDYRIQFKSSESIFPGHKSFPNTLLNFAPVIIRANGQCIEMTKSNLILYGSIISRERQSCNHSASENEQFEFPSDSISYTFKNDYVFVVGDNYFSSSDSRHWGFLPVSCIYNKMCFVLRIGNP